MSLKATIKFQMKKVMCLNVAVGNVSWSVRANTQLVANFRFASQQWQNITDRSSSRSAVPRFYF
jgi:large subunit ribosomal protein L10Ae